MIRAIDWLACFFGKRKVIPRKRRVVTRIVKEGNPTHAHTLSKIPWDLRYGNEVEVPEGQTWWFNHYTLLECSCGKKVVEGRADYI